MNKDVSRLITRCEQYEREVGELKKEIERLKAQTDKIKVGDEVEVFQATINPWTCKGEIGQRGAVTGIISEIGWRNSHCIDVDVVEIGEDNAFALCDVRKVC